MAQSLSRSARSRSQAVTAKKMKKAATAATTNEVTHIPPQERCALVLQGGGALGAYQGGVYEQLAAHGVLPDWVAGISIGAINAALIAGNPPERRVERLRQFWTLITERLSYIDLPDHFGATVREWLNESRAAWVAGVGIAGFFRPRLPPPYLQTPGTSAALSFYDTSELAETLGQLVDFDLINDRHSRHHVRLSVGAVNVRTGAYRYFDSDDPRGGGPLGPAHIMASGALPPGFPPIEIDGEQYWDGGIVSNTPLQYVLDQPRRHDLLVVQVDLFSAQGTLPRHLGEVGEREKDIRFASRTHYHTDQAAHSERMCAAAHRLAARLPKGFEKDADLAELLASGSPAALTVLHLIYRSKYYETQSKDYEFSRQSMQEHWAAGAVDVQASLGHHRWCTRPRTGHHVTVLDCLQP